MEPKSRNINVWLNKSFSIESENYDEAKRALIDIIPKQGFKIKDQKESEDSFNIKAMFGSKLKAIFMGLIPFGKHLPSGKRLQLTAVLSKKSALKLNMQITPYMELFSDEEVMGVSQSFDEKVSDEYFGAKLMHRIINNLYESLKLPIPEDIQQFDKKQFAKDSFWGLLIYPLDSNKSSKVIHIPTEQGPKWCWGGFIIPEFWFLWNEIWGVSLLTWIPMGLYYYSVNWGFFKYIFLSIVIAVRIFLAIKGNQIYYAKYGKWPK